MYIFKGLKFK